jgi:hypothetical protein
MTCERKMMKTFILIDIYIYPHVNNVYTNNNMTQQLHSPEGEMENPKKIWGRRAGPTFRREKNTRKIRDDWERKRGFSEK